MSEFDPMVSDQPLIVYVDIKSPYAFIAKDPTWALADELNIEIDWRPLTLDIPSYLGSAKLDKSGKVAKSNRTAQQWGGVRYAYMDARRYAAAYGYGLRGTEKIWDTRLIHIAFLWVKRAGQLPMRKFLDAVYPPFWVRDLDVESEPVVVSCIEAAGVSSTGFLEWAASDGGIEHDQQQTAVFDAGIYGVPGYVHDGDYFFGREHLPAIRNRLIAQRAGEQAQLADIANPLPPLDELQRNAHARDSKALVFVDMWESAKAGRLEITAGVNPTCVESKLAQIEIERLQRLHPDQLFVQWGELPCRPPQNSPPANSSASRGERHRATRARYQYSDLARYAKIIDSAPEKAGVQPVGTVSAAQLLQNNGVSQSFGYVYKDSDGNQHPFNGRQHLSVLQWAISGANDKQ